MKKIVSVSLGSKRGDFERSIVLDRHQVSLSRCGTDGDMVRAISMIAELDGKVDAIGLGGIDIYLYVGDMQLVIGDGMKLRDVAKLTPVVDGSGLKNTLERTVVHDLVDFGLVDGSSKVLMVSALDRFGMAESFVEVGCSCVFGDLIFNIGLDFPLKSLADIEEIARKYRTRLLTVPFHLLYPTGSSQDSNTAESKYAKYYDAADIVAGDAHLILRHMPESIAGKGIVTNTTRSFTLERFKNAGAAWIMTTTPNLDGVSGGTNIMEAALVAIMGKPLQAINADDYAEWIDRLDWHGSLIRLAP